MAVAQQRPRGVGPGQDVEGQQEDLGVPEHVAPVALAGQRVRADVDRRVVGVGRDQQVVDAEPQRAGEALVADDLAVAVLPQAPPDRPAGLDDGVEPARPGQCRATATLQGPGVVRVAGRADGHQLVQPQGLPRRHPLHDLLGDPRAALPHAPPPRRRRAGRRRGVPHVHAGVDRAHLQVDAVTVDDPRRLLQVLRPRPLLPPGPRREHRALRVHGQPFEVAPVAVDPGLDPDLGVVVLRRDLHPQGADPAVGHARAAHRLQPGAAAPAVLEDRGPGEQAVVQVQGAVVRDDGDRVDVEPDPVDEHGRVHPVRGVDQVDHGDAVPVVDPGQERGRELPRVALLQAPPGADPAVPDREHGLVEVRPGRVEPGLLDEPGAGRHDREP